MADTCSSCSNKIEFSWRYCRYCGQSLKVRKPQIDLSEVEQTREIKERVEFDRDLYEKVLSNRSERTELIREKKTVNADIASLLEQLEAGIVSRDYALPKIKELKKKVTDISTREEKFEGLPEQLPIEILVDQIEDAEERMRKIGTLKDDPAITKAALKEAKKRAEESLKLLREEYAVVAGHLRIWQGKLENTLEDERKNLEQLYIRVKTGELTEDAYVEKKSAKAAEIARISNMSEMLKTMTDI